ncbi:MAG: hypothetical protein KBA75_01460 [Alphaproteobacteria bacterium]|nr:hypothetical protein [Alphaproteobacteria bacterium]
MNKLFGAAATLVTEVVGLAIAGYTIKYAIDAYNGHYCIPVSSEYAVARHAASLGNNIVNGIAHLTEKPRCPAPPVFVVPTARQDKPGM